MTNAPSALDIARKLVQCPSVTPEEGGALAYLDTLLSPVGFQVHRPVFSESGTPDVENLFAKLSHGKGPHLVFAGHTDVVPTGDEGLWTLPPFSGEVKEGMLYGRGTADMKGGIAAFSAAVLQYLAEHGEPEGSISFLITGDEEGPATNGTVKLLQWAADKGEHFSDAIVGEPTNPDAMGDAIKIGRRGSLSGTITVTGHQGHVAYPHLAHNPVTIMAQIVSKISAAVLDHGTDHFQPTNLEFISIDVGNEAWNLIPKKATARFNVRHNDLWDAQKLSDFVMKNAKDCIPSSDFDVTLGLIPSNADAFLTRSDTLIQSFSESVKKITGRTPEHSTDGGTSDARFIKNYCPVIEFGLVGKTMHMIDEHIAVDDLKTLTDIYYDFLMRYFPPKG
ncbi:succinyl-diaminopimelate desuccinylase [Cohaesibacter celericrescens]|uniref:Succinyl-diaminopimelate desuccinylase n=1 Tax=Cohaesibacter celericrescens TaxID=2067669 RepID=A0A2N5XMY2_9HYPH|nr:succinyl-diaminopimelate desuccinylase [Cohaesibacter celericrescens]PLW75800.1 succinyl-diaminopimelate desuccinylase [Cohaesibacter celericrescens]